MTEFLDELARSMAKPMPRRGALRLLGGLLVASAVPGALRTSAALGGAKASRRIGTCNPRCTNPATPRPFACVVNAAKDICFITCGPPGSSKCCFKDASGKPNGIVACPDGYRCGKPGEQSCVCLKNCGGDCCKSGEYCANFQQRLCCKQGEDRCGPRCCKVNEECTTIRVGTGSERVCEKKCPQGEAWCDRKKCCPRGWSCVFGPTGWQCRRCRPDQQECGKKCCDKKTSRCCGRAGCCPKSRSCCNGKCVDAQNDPANCGRCGNVCESGVCGRGICALR